ncbi:MAG: thioesterase family protein [Actinobacteria bacterium]|nr:thioesterase family protein [Actinomycetota bacterium]
MVDAMFERDGMRVHPGPLCTGPWDPSSMHGGPPTVLAGRYLAEHGAGDAFHLARLTVELVRPVPLVPLTVEIRETRPGRRIQLLDLVLRDEQDTELVYARGMRIARGDNGLDESLLDMPGPVAVAGPDDSSPYEHGYPLPACGFYMDAFDIRSVDGRSFGAVGPSASWFRLLAPVFAGEPITPLDRVLAVADFGNGISNIIEMGRHVYINPDLTVNVHRLPRGEWLLSDAVTHLRADGYGTATATLADANGLLGIANQSLLVVPAS